MQSAEGFVKLFRKFKYWGWYQDPIVKVVFLHCLLSASYSEFEWMGARYAPGQFITSIGNLANEVGISVQQTRTALKKLTNSGEITVNATNKFTIIKVIKWANYQSCDNESNKQITNKQQSDNNQTTNEQQQYKNKKNIKNINNYSSRGRERKRSLDSSSIDWSLVDRIIAES